ncbi:hypothetical protein [Terriglobus roseus]|nr:hypothetical protein [Terriglobus roseus]
MRRDTRSILRFSVTTVVIGFVCAAAVYASGGMTSHGPHGTVGWFALLVALCCLPAGSFFLILGIAKWSGDRSRTD